MNKEEFENQLSEKITNVMEVGLYRKIKLNTLLNEVQRIILDSINFKNVNNEIFKFEIKLTENDYTKYFGNELDKDISQEYFIRKCLENDITCDFCHIKYNTRIFDSYYIITVKYKNPNYKKLTLK